MVLLSFCVHFLFTEAAESHGFGDNVNWIDYNSAMADFTKPSLVILHKSWCPACRTLKSKLAHSPEFVELSEKFSMVNANEDDKEADYNILKTNIVMVFEWQEFYIATVI